ncbi:MAG: sialidase family protein [Pirellulaceae bacterium]
MNTRLIAVGMALALLFLQLEASIALQEDSQAGELKFVDLNEHAEMQVVVDQEQGQYLGHPTTLLLEDGKTILCVYPKGHGRGPVIYKRSSDGGKTWSDRLPTPANWETSKETPTLHRVVAPNGRKRVIMFSGLYPARMAHSDDDGETWSELEPIGDWGGIVVMGSVFDLKTGPGHYMAMFHDDGRFLTADGKRENPVHFKLLQVTSEDGGMTWSTPRVVLEGSRMHLCEPGVIRSPDGATLACLLRENRRESPSQIIFSKDEGATWTEPRPLPFDLCGDRHTGKYSPDGRLLISYRRVCVNGESSPVDGDWVAWVGTFEDLEKGSSGQYLLRLKDNTKGRDCAYPGVEVLPDGTFVTTTYGHWVEGEQPYILSVRFDLKQIDALAEEN